MRPPISQYVELGFLLELSALARLMRIHADRVAAAANEWHEHEAHAQAAIRLSLERPGEGGARATSEATMRMGDCQREVWVGIDGFLSAWGRASLVLWPSPGGRRSKVQQGRALARGGYMRHVLAFDDAHVLNSRELRNSWMHFDERLDDAYAEHGRGITLQKFRRADEVPTGLIMRDFDLTNLTITVDGVRHELADLFAAGEDLGERALEATRTLASRRYADREGEP